MIPMPFHRMVRSLLSVSALASLAALLSCAAPGGAGYSPRNAEEAFVVQTVSAMTDALNAGDTARFMAKVSSGYYRGAASLETRIGAGLANRPGFRIETSVLGMEMDDTKVTARVRWKASWRKEAESGARMLEGENNLVFMRGMGLKLIDQRESMLLGF